MSFLGDSMGKRRKILHNAPSGSTAVEAVFTDSEGLRWNNVEAEMQAHADLDWDDYCIEATRQGTSLQFVIPIPDKLPSGLYLVEVFNTADPDVGASPDAMHTFGWMNVGGVRSIVEPKIA